MQAKDGKEGDLDAIKGPEMYPMFTGSGTYLLLPSLPTVILIKKLNQPFKC